MWCSKCKLDKPLEDFYVSRVTKRGYSYWCRACTKIAHNSWKQRNLSKAKSSEAARKVKARYGLTPDEHTTMLKSQDHKCAICGVAFEEVTSHIDHDHSTKKVRGILCRHCNRGLGAFMDNPELLRKAAQYLCQGETCPK